MCWRKLDERNENILQKKIGIVGCGEMGLPMLEVLLKNKISALGFDIRSKSEFSSVKENFLENKVEFFKAQSSITNRFAYFKKKRLFLYRLKICRFTMK